MPASATWGSPVARPEGGYQNLAGEPVPGASTVAKIGQESGGIVYWAWKQGRDGKDFRESRDAAATAGSMVHTAAEAWKQGQPYLWQGEPDVVAKAQVGFGAFVEWATMTRLKIEESEVSLVSERH